MSITFTPDLLTRTIGHLRASETFPVPPANVISDAKDACHNTERTIWDNGRPRFLTNTERSRHCKRFAAYSRSQRTMEVIAAVATLITYGQLIAFSIDPKLSSLKCDSTYCQVKYAVDLAMCIYANIQNRGTLAQVGE